MALPLCTTVAPEPDQPVDDPVHRVLVARDQRATPAARCRPRRCRCGGRGWPCATAPPSARPASRCTSARPGRRGRSSSVLTSTTAPAGHGEVARGRGRCPCCAPSTGRRRRPCGRARRAASSTCWTRCTWEAKQATMIRRSACRNTRSIAGDDVALGRGEPRHLGVGGVDEEQVDALLAEPGERPQVGEPPVERQLVHLEVAGVQQQARRRCGSRRRARRGWSG